MFIDVRDHGSGIPDEDQERIFERNERGKGLTEGSGLGLYLARIWARLLGGDVELVWSRSGEGSLFRIILPYVEPGEPPSSDEQTDSAPPTVPQDSTTSGEQGESLAPGQQNDLPHSDTAAEGEIL